MKKITFLFIMFTLLSYSQSYKSQMDFIKKVNKYYPEFSVNCNVRDFFENGKLLKSYIEYSTPPNDCDDYEIILQPDNKKITYSEVYGEYNGNATFTGSYYVLNSFVYKSQISKKGSKTITTLYRNGKVINEKRS
ncbi:hypothetical protein [Flavobacterium sp. LB1P71]|uniref:hypothetical protein n=1 Tax=Flavobacterium sp. LB1P71 TaxID=3401716 RepID=UPI003AAF7D5A